MKISSGLCVIFLALCFVISLASAETGDIPVLIGNWTGTSEGHYAERGYIGEETFLYSFVVNDQKERVFNGTLFEEGINGHREYPFSGVIAPDMKTLHIADYDEGYNIGYLTSTGELELILLIDGKKGLSDFCTMRKKE